MGFISLLVLKLLWMEWIYKKEKKKNMKILIYYII